MKLESYHFITPPKPNNEDELKDWNSKFGEKPEPEWVEGIPDHLLLPKITFHREKESPDCPLDIHRYYFIEPYLNRLKIWQDHQVRYPGFNIINSPLYDGNLFEKNKISILFLNNGNFELGMWNGKFEIRIWNDKPISIELFERICKENNIEL